MLQTKDATIETQQLKIDIQRSVLSGEIVFDSLKNITPKPENKEELLGDIVSLIPLKGKGLK